MDSLLRGASLLHHNDEQSSCEQYEAAADDGEDHGAVAAGLGQLSLGIFDRYGHRAAAVGFIGQNNFFISPEYGLRTIIGVIVCNIPADRFAPHAPLAATECGACGACLRACPSGALRAPFEIDAAKCLSYLTIESKDPLPETFSTLESRRGWRFGCEECMRVCPWDKPLTPLPEFETHRAELEKMSDTDWSSMPEQEFEKRFADSGLRRAGLENLRWH